MIGEHQERWRQLCQQAAKEQDPTQLRKLIEEINGLLDEKYKSVEQRSTATADATNSQPISP